MVLIEFLREHSLFLNIIGFFLAVLELYFPKISKQLEAEIDAKQPVFDERWKRYGKVFINPKGFVSKTSDLFSELVLGRYGAGPIEKGMKILPLSIIAGVFYSLYLVFFNTDKLAISPFWVITIFLIGSILFPFILYYSLSFLIWIFLILILIFIGLPLTIAYFVFANFIRFLNWMSFGHAIGSIGIILAALGFLL